MRFLDHACTVSGAENVQTLALAAASFAAAADARAFLAAVLVCFVTAGFTDGLPVDGEVDLVGALRTSFRCSSSKCVNSRQAYTLSLLQKRAGVGQNPRPAAWQNDCVAESMAVT